MKHSMELIVKINGTQLEPWLQYIQYLKFFISKNVDQEKLTKNIHGIYKRALQYSKGDKKYLQGQFYQF